MDGGPEMVGVKRTDNFFEIGNTGKEKTVDAGEILGGKQIEKFDDIGVAQTRKNSIENKLVVKIDQKPLGHELSRE